MPVMPWGGPRQATHACSFSTSRCTSVGSRSKPPFCACCIPGCLTKRRRGQELSHQQQLLPDVCGVNSLPRSRRKDSRQGGTAKAAPVLAPGTRDRFKQSVVAIAGAVLGPWVRRTRRGYRRRRPRRRSPVTRRKPIGVPPRLALLFSGRFFVRQCAGPCE